VIGRLFLATCLYAPALERKKISMLISPPESYAVEVTCILRGYEISYLQHNLLACYVFMFALGYTHSRALLILRGI